MNKTTLRFGFRGAQQWLVNVAIVLGSMALAIVVFTTAADTIPARPAFVAPAMFSWEGGEAPDVNVTAPTSDHAALVPDDKLAAPTAEPRECLPDRGIVSDCTFD
jgi:hypothetical protein